MRFCSISKHGQDIKEFEGVHSDTLQRYYNVDGEVITRSQMQSGAGHPTDENSSDSDSESVHDTEGPEYEEDLELPPGIDAVAFRALHDRIEQSV